MPNIIEMRIIALKAATQITYKQGGVQNLLSYAGYIFDFLKSGNTSPTTEKTEQDNN